MSIEHVDLTLLGGGVSSTATLDQLVRHLNQQSPFVSRPLRLRLIDKNGDFGGGVPYGNSVPWAFLCNEPASAQHSAGFIVWLGKNRDRWIGKLKASGSSGVRWLDKNSVMLERARSDPKCYGGLFVPRFIYGDFLKEILENALTAARSNRYLEPALIKDEVRSIERLPGGQLRLELLSGSALITRLLVLAMGSPPAKRLPALVGQKRYLIAPSSESIPQLEANLLPWLRSCGLRRRELMILGSNASALEAISYLFSQNLTSAVLPKVKVLTTTKRFPDATPSQHGIQPTMTSLAQLMCQSSLTAENVFDAARSDARRCVDSGLTALDYSHGLHELSQSLLERLSQYERRRFVEEFGRRFKALTRHTPTDYHADLEELTRLGLLELLPGAVVSAKSDPSGFRICLRDASGNDEFTLSECILDCRGWSYLDELNDPLWRSILAPETGVARINGSRIGLAVDESFEASPGVFVMGPLLAGFCTAERMIWNLENARRIFELAPVLAQVLANRLSLTVV